MSDFFKKHKKNIIYSTASAILVLAVVFTCVFFYHESFNDEILGAPYTPEEFLLPEPPPPVEVPPLPQPAGRFVAEVPDQKTVYLTFDDGPSPVTEQILDVLKKENIPATFFVLGKNVEEYPDLTKRIASEGHKIANHSYSHDYKQIYKTDDETFLNEVLKTEEIILSLVDRVSYSKVFRFPGGSFEDYKWPKMDVLIENDYSFIDWNCSNGDAEGHDIPPEKLTSKTIATAGNKNAVVVLMHDAGRKYTTPLALPDIIRYFRENGYVFSTIYR